MPSTSEDLIKSSIFKYSEIQFFPAAVIRFEQTVRDKCDMVFQRANTEVFSWDGLMPGLDGGQVEGEFQPDFIWQNSGGIS